MNPAIEANHGRVVKQTRGGILIEFQSVVDAVRCAIEVQNGMVERNSGPLGLMGSAQRRYRRFGEEGHCWTGDLTHSASPAPFPPRR
jgi:hypothetical protein